MKSNKIKIILTVSLILAGGLLFSSKVFADCSSGECRTVCQDTEKPTGEKCTYSQGDNSQEADCCLKKSGIDLTSGKPCSEDKGMVAGRCYVSGSVGIMGCAGIGPGEALGEKGQLGCPSDQICCKTQEYKDATQGKPATTSATPSSPATSSAIPASSNSGAMSGLVPCRDNCTLCHLILGFKRIFDFLLGLLFIATMLVITVAGVFYVVSTGSKGMIDKAKKALTYGLLAFVIGMGSWLFVNLVMQMVGFQHPTGGQWWQFTCDTAQTRGPALGSGGTPVTGGAPGTIGTGSGGKPSGTGLVTGGQETLDQLAARLKGSTIYDSGRQGWSGDGNFHGDCSSWAQEFFKEAYGIDPGGTTAQMRQNANGNTDRSTLTPGDLLIVNGSHGDGTHAVIYLGGDSVIGNSTEGVNVKYGKLSGYNTISAVIKAPSTKK